VLRRLRVVHVISALPVGGVETNLLRVLPRIDRGRFEVSLVVTRERGALADRLEAAGIPVTLVYQRTRYSPRSLLRLRNHFRARRADIVHGHMRRANTSARMAALLGGAPVRIATEHDMCLGKTSRHLLVDRILARYTDTILGVTEAVCDMNSRLSGIPRERFRVMYLGLELDRLADQPAPSDARLSLGLPVEAPLVGYLGRLHTIKNVDALIRSLADPALADAHLAVVGDGRESERVRLASDVRELGLSTRVHFLGWRSDLPVVLAALDVLALPSSSEGIATVQMEALAGGVPLVSTPVGFAAEVLAPGRDYIPVERPEPALLAAGIAEALRPERSAELVEAGRRRIRGFSIDNQARFLESLYLELARSRGLIETEQTAPDGPP
jgi:glycosyltransferase involved in cell wall biosynthesis